MLNPWIILAAVIGFGAATGGAYIKGRSDGRATERVKQMTLDDVARTATEAAAIAAAEEIRRLKIVHTTIRQQAETVIREKQIYRDCYNDTSVVGLLDAARAGDAPSQSAGSGQLSGADAGATSDVR